MSAPSTENLVACQAISNGALSAPELPARIKLLNWGRNPSLKGDILIGSRTLAELPANQARHGFDKVGVDYEHQSVEGHPNFKPAPREYAAYGVPEVIEGDGLYLTDLQWTPSGRQHAKNYCDLSPVVLRDDGGEVTFLHSVALCPQGAVHGLEFFTSSSSSMHPELKALLTALFGLPEDADDDAILAAGREYVRKLNGHPAPEAAPEPAPDMAALSARLDALSTALDDLRRQALIEAATREGKVVPAAARDLPLDKLSALCAELPATVPVTPLTPAAARPEPLSHLSPTDLLVCQQLGLDPQSLTK